MIVKASPSLFASNRQHIKLCWICCFYILVTNIVAEENFSESSIQQQDYIPFGFQAEEGYNKNGTPLSSYAVDMVYNERSREITITGGTYSNYFNRGAGYNMVQNDGDGGDEDDEKQIGRSDCFVAMLHLPHQVVEPSNSIATTRKPSWIRRRQIGNPSANEFCSSIHVIQGDRGGTLAIGHSGKGGILDSLLPYGSDHRSIYGMILDLDGDSIDLRGGEILHSNQVQYPTAITSDPITGDIYLAEIISETDSTSNKIDPFYDSRFYNGGDDLSATSYKKPMYGDHFSVGLKKFSVKANLTEPRLISSTFNPGWSRQFGTMRNEDVQVAGMVYISPSVMLLTGYTMGEGGAFGHIGEANKNDLDGFLTMIDPQSGTVIHSIRVRSTLMNGDDRILGLCRNYHDVDSSVVYFVGATDGVFDTSYFEQEDDVTSRRLLQNDAFLLKFDLNGMKIVWIRQIEGKFPPWMQSNTATGPQVHGTSCAVTPDGEHVYMGGNVKNWASLAIKDQADEFQSSGADDIFVAKFRSDDGKLMFAHQVGSDEDDSLANNKGLVTDQSGNLIILGNTRGSLYRGKTRNRISDIFVMSMHEEDGEYLPTFSQQSKKDAWDHKDGDRLKHSGGLFQGRMFYAEWWTQHNIAIVVLGSLLGVALILFGIALFVRQRRTKERKQQVLEDYLRWLDDLDEYEDEPVTMKETYSGGWKITHREDIMDSSSRGNKSNRRVQFQDLLSTPTVTTDDATEDEESVITLTGRRPPIQQRQQNIFRREPPLLLDPDLNSGRRRPRRESSILQNGGHHRSQSTNTRDPYDEIHDLLATASRRVSAQTKKAKAKTKQFSI